jgi:hypothetical protein
MGKKNTIFTWARDKVTPNFVTTALHQSLRNEPNPILEEFLDVAAKDLNPR